MSVLQDFENTVKNKEIFLIGGGNSFKFDLIKHLQGKPVISLNSSFEDFPNALAVCWMDSIWYSNNFERLKKHKSNFKFYVKDNVTDKKEIYGPFGITYLNRKSSKCEYENIFDGTISVKGNNLGCCIIDLLIQCQVKKILLLGFDCKLINKKSHYHDRYDIIIPPKVYTDGFIPCFNSISKYAKKKNVKIINLSTDSDLKCFNFEPLNNYINF